MAPLASSLAARVPWTLSRPAAEWRSLAPLPRGRRGLRRREVQAEVAAAVLPVTASSSDCTPLGARQPWARFGCGVLGDRLQ